MDDQNNVNTSKRRKGYPEETPEFEDNYEAFKTSKATLKRKRNRRRVRERLWAARYETMTSKLGVARDAPDLGNFPPEIQDIITRSVEDPEELPIAALAELARQVLERAMASVYCVTPAVKLSMRIIERDTKENYLECLLKFCTKFYQERERTLKNTSCFSAYPSPRFSAFRQFLQELYWRLKVRESSLTLKYQGMTPVKAILTILYSSCLDCLIPPISQGEIDSLSFTMTSTGADLETELPTGFPKLMDNIRDAFLQTATIPSAKKSLLHIIELKASNWELSSEAITYYVTN